MFNPSFEITPQILHSLNRIEVIKEKISTCKIHPKAEYRLKQDAVVSMVHHSTAIEGNPLNSYEVQQVLAGKIVEHSARAINEVVNYKKALDFVSKKKTQEIAAKDILRLHRLTTVNILPKNQCGHFRDQVVYVVSRTPTSYTIRYTAPDQRKVSALVKNLCLWTKGARQNKLSPILIAGLAHAEVAAIHPFVDGNGRTARLLATLILYTQGYDIRKWFALENYYNTNRPAYYEAIHLGKTYEERSRNSLTHWLEYFVEGFRTEMELLLDKVKPFLHLKKSSSKPVVLSRPEIQILDFLQEMSPIRSKDVEAVLTVSQRTAQRTLAKLIKKGLIKKRGTRKDAVYELKN